MAWTVRLEKRAVRQLAKLGQVSQRLIQDYINERLIPSDDPRSFGKALGGDKHGIWRYRVDKYRILCRIIDEYLVIMVIEIGKRDSIYD